MKLLSSTSSNSENNKIYTKIRLRLYRHIEWWHSIA
uniref:Uncharacterized protein n=1 Tax=Siphoviridae sp. ctP0x5 TaxID=2827863 RepID=A0A8S5TFK8_9CAUD|nr:MAG TPA: hypothetical protein [Siphoviridae sp. ctP0x5]DAM50435.1 MAG TPA: hypothetical protein [Caudoviricetes sp.]